MQDTAARAARPSPTNLCHRRRSPLAETDLSSLLHGVSQTDSFILYTLYFLHGVSQTDSVVTAMTKGITASSSHGSSQQPAAGRERRAASSNGSRVGGSRSMLPRRATTRRRRQYLNRPRRTLRGLLRWRRMEKGECRRRGRDERGACRRRNPGVQAACQLHKEPQYSI